MKKLFFIFTISVLFFFSDRCVQAQSVRLDTIFGFPDTIVDGQVVVLSLHISNFGGVSFNGDLAIVMHSDSVISAIDTLYYDSNYALQTAITDTITISHTFDAADFDAGDNIVVVWPVSSQSAALVNQDSLVFHVIFNNVGIGKNQIQPVVELYPNPSGNLIHLRFSHPEKVEQVRVFDVLGKEQLRFDEVISEINVGSLDSGVYFVEVLHKDGSLIVKKFLRE